MDANRVAFSSATVSSLLNNCLETISRNVVRHQQYFDTLPTNLKNKLIKKLSMRGVMTNYLLQKLLHAKVKLLNLSSCDISDEGLSVISDRCTQLTKLDFNAESEPRDNITAHGVVQVAINCVNLHTVFLRRCVNITDDAIVALATHCPNLTNLNLGGCHQITDNSLVTLADTCCNLESINVSHTQITDDGLIAISRGKCQRSIKEIHFAYCSDVSDRAVISLIELCQHITILIFHGCPQITEQSRDVLEMLLRRGSKQLSWTVY